MYKKYLIRFSFQNINSIYYWEKEFYTENLDKTINGYLSKKEYFGYEEITLKDISFKIFK